MTIDELIRLLVKYPPGMRVVVNGYEGGYDDLTPEQVAPIKIALNTGGNRWEGQHSDPNDFPGDAQVVEALVLRRVSN